MAFKKGQGGRPKGAKNLITKAKGERKMTALALAATSAIPSTGIILPPVAPAVAPPGIEPKDLLLSAMRGAWEAAHRKSAEAEQLDELAAAATDSETIEQFRKTANEVRVEVGRQVALATNLAKDVAPYMHPKLANVDTKVAGGLVIQLKQYAPA